MNPTTRQLFASTMERVNARELKARTDYFAYLSTKGEQDGTLDEFIAKYASLARFGRPASAATVERLRLLSGPPIPQSLADFYLNYHQRQERLLGPSHKEIASWLVYAKPLY